MKAAHHVSPCDAQQSIVLDCDRVELPCRVLADVEQKKEALRARASEARNLDNFELHGVWG